MNQVIYFTLLLLWSLQSSRSDKAIPAGKKSPNVDKPIPIIDVYAVVGDKAELPCNIQPSDPSDDVYLVLWYRDLAGKPLYSFDVRGRLEDDAKHWSAKHPFGNRAYFRVGNDPTFLLIDAIRLEDEGVYRCRVDYRNSPTRNIKLNLTVVVPPDAPRLTGPRGKDVNGAIAGPYNQGDELQLICDVVGGRPRPSVTWWMNGKLIDATFEIEHRRESVVNKLRYITVTREMDNALFECRASNNNVTQALSRRIRIEINLNPIMVEVIRKPEFFRADENYELVCISRGSKPAAVITWSKNNRQIEENFIDTQTQGGETRSVYTYIPAQDENGYRITCRAENPNILNSAIEDVVQVAVMYPPSLSLRLGRSLNAEDIKEGADVYFECHIESNPSVKKIQWVHGDKPLYHNVSDGVILSNFSLVIQRITRSRAGEYKCLASNPHGQGMSNPVSLQVKYRPVCAGTGPTVFGVPKESNVTVKCELSSNPPVTKFRWWFNSSGKAVNVLSTKYKHHGSISIVQYKPDSDLDYGTLSCLGINDIGRQVEPCSFKITPVSRPNAPGNCTLNNQTADLLIVSCTASYNGGNGQEFILEVYDMITDRLIQNVSNPQVPLFRLGNFRNENLVMFKVYSVNQRGKSEVVVYSDIHVNKPEKRTEIVFSSAFGTNSLLLLVSGIGVSLILIGILLILLLHKRKVLTKKLTNCRSSGSTPPQTSSPARKNETGSLISSKNLESSPPGSLNNNSSLQYGIVNKVNEEVDLRSRVINPLVSTVAIAKPASSNDAIDRHGGITPPPAYNRQGNWYSQSFGS
ncbi:neural cell adhesion molecule 2 isoform X2 [Lepeophtheirus salmonis]|uniref:neural cell adhesion molecule 2 isoform X2 n=1 Tax=Lepeophtheirus salmonis TaxID=72036 RepID=UPI003AF39F36